MRFATIVRVLLALMSGIPAALAYDPLDFLVENWGGKRAGLYDTVTWEKHDLPGLAGPPGGYQVSHSVLPGGPWVLQTWSFAPFQKFVPSSGDGGQAVYYGYDRAATIITRDGGSPSNQYFAPPGCPYLEGWLYFYVSTLQFGGNWNGTTTHLVDVTTPSGNCPVPSNSFARWRVEYAKMFFLWQGAPSWQDTLILISEIYSGPSVAQSGAMERTFFALGYGMIRWEAWVTNPNVTQGVDLPSRCPGVYIRGGAWPVAEPAQGWILHDCRQWTNMIYDNSGSKTIAGMSWIP
jgi:hypothetical protein